MCRVAAFVLTLLLCGTAIAAELTGRVVAIADGDTLTVLVGLRPIKVRLSEIDAPERRQPFGMVSRRSLAEICFDKATTINDSMRDRNRRVVSVVTCAGTDANAEQVRRGMAWVFDRYSKRDSPLYGLQDAARTARAGLWADAYPIEPWMWRKGARN